MEYEGMVYRPPSEARSFILQVTIGCAHNACTFCTMYKDKQFRIRPMEDIEADIREISGYYGNQRIRIFLADGDALVLPTEKLVHILDYLHKYFPYAERITSYGAPRDVLRKSVEELKLLKEHGLHMVYMGLESGDDEILRAVKKGVTSAEIIEACQKLRAGGILSSVTLISGLGGSEHLTSHALKSAEAISKMHPDYVGFLTLMIEPGAPIAEEIRSGKLTLLTPEEVVDEMELFLTHVDSPGTVFRANHASNYMILKGNLNEDIPAMIEQIHTIRDRSGFRKERWRAL
ncbi:MAG: radical SAM protein [Lachnospiraceae bacterium]|nr:radical SAM protein [Lachnospiraceae bacterium]